MKNVWCAQPGGRETVAGLGLGIECPKVKIKTEYKGKTARNPYSQGMEHKRHMDNMCEKSPLWNYCSIQHGGRIVQFKMDALRANGGASQRGGKGQVE